MPTERELRIAELQSDLALTRTAIRTIVRGGQAYSADGRAMTRADLRALRELEKDLAGELVQLQRGTGTKIYGAVYR